MPTLRCAATPPRAQAALPCMRRKHTPGPPPAPSPSSSALGDAPPLVLAIPAIMPKFISVLQPHVAELAPVLPTLAACHVHEPAHVDLALESAVAADHGNVVHVERDGPRRQASLLPALARRAAVLDGLEGLHGDRRVALATDHTRRLRQKLSVFVKVLDRPLRPACRALVLEELEGGVSLSAAVSSLGML
eukprot:CAMPEP_0183576608 /NCGR_PEP_ID=MMETSP0371-20130417/138064_1 /TAXON_ID=268820 /ORGANISM="Peridinium aciculiferum, Strain PAER-2" /LENGTH=190 /DNA_ID=CAMNT_0025786875 /DNA_START=34 /DNA_END=603 /DNA_ORIENTATION=+